MYGLHQRQISSVLNQGNAGGQRGNYVGRSLQQLHDQLLRERQENLPDQDRRRGTTTNLAATTPEEDHQNQMK